MLYRGLNFDPPSIFNLFSRDLYLIQVLESSRFSPVCIHNPPSFFLSFFLSYFLFSLSLYFISDLFSPSQRCSGVCFTPALYLYLFVPSPIFIPLHLIFIQAYNRSRFLLPWLGRKENIPFRLFSYYFGFFKFIYDFRFRFEDNYDPCIV